jgi:tetratricopeptide (TPR) repeat protein
MEAVSRADAADIITQRVPKIACASCGRRLDVSALEPFSSIECPDCHTVLIVPAVLGQFLLTELLGAGGMGAVYKAMDQTLGRFVAIKVMKKALGENPQLVESFFREARAAAALNHPNIVQIYSCGQEKMQPYIVMELVGGGRLDQLMKDNEPVDEVRVLEVGLNVAEGLRAAHEVGLVHGDIKPANILFDTHGVAKVVDFGLAQFVNLQQQRGEIWGTPYYIAPEVARGQKADHRSDVYSLGGTLFHALTSKPPFDGPTAADVVLARLKQPPPLLLDLNPTCRPQTSELINRMLAVDPFVRYPTSASLMADMKDALNAAREEAKLREAAKIKQPVRMSGKQKAVLGGVLAVLLAGVGYGLYHLAEQVRSHTPIRPVHRPAPSTATVAEAAATNAVSEAEREAERLKQINFFKENGEAYIVNAVNELTGPKPMDMYARMEELHAQLQPASSRALWVRLFQVVPCWTDRRDQDARDLLNGIASVDIRQKDNHPAFMPKIMAEFLLGRIDDGQVNFRSEGWPRWYRDLVLFYHGTREFSRGDLEAAAPLLDAFVAIPTNEPAWVYAYKPVAQLWLSQMREWGDVRNEAAELVAARQAAAAREVLERFQARVQPILGSQVNVEIARVKDAERREAEQKELARALAYREQVQKELERVDEVLAQNVPLVVSQKDYRKAGQALFKLQQELKTQDARALCENLRAGYERLDDLKTFFITRIATDPFKAGAGTELGGEGIGANSQGVRVSLGGRGVVVKPWEQLSAATLLKMANYYITDAKGMPAKEQADKLISVAVFCYLNGGYDEATKYAEKAIDLDASLSRTVRKLMPGIVKN